MSDSESNLFDRLKAFGEDLAGRVSNELMQNEHFVKAMQGALAGKEKVDRAVGQALKSMNVPTRSELKRAVARIEALEQEVAGLREKLRSAARAGAAPRKGGSAGKGAPGSKSDKGKKR